MADSDPTDGGDGLSEELTIALPVHRWGVVWFGDLQPTPIRIHYDPDHQRFWFTDHCGRRLPTDRCEVHGGRSVADAKERLVHIHATRQGITERMRRRHPAPDPSTTGQTTVPSPTTAPAVPPAPPPLPVRTPQTPPAGSTGHAPVEVSPFSDVPGDPPPIEPATARTTSVFKPRRTKVVDVLARVRNTDRIRKAQKLDEPPDPFAQARR